MVTFVGVLGSFVEERIHDLRHPMSVDDLLGRVQDDGVRLSSLLPHIRRAARAAEDGVFGEILDCELRGYSQGTGEPEIVNQPGGYEPTGELDWGLLEIPDPTDAPPAVGLDDVTKG